MDSLFAVHFLLRGQGTKKKVKRVEKNKAEGNGSADSSSWDSGFQKHTRILW